MQQAPRQPNVHCVLHSILRTFREQGWVDWFKESLPIYFCDNQAAIAIAKSTVVTRIKHFDLRLHEVSAIVDQLAFVPTLLNKADSLTKGGPHGSVFTPEAEEKAPVVEEEEEEGEAQQAYLAYFVDV